MSNPLLQAHELPPFSSIKPEHVVAAISELVEQNLQTVEQLAEQNSTRASWQSLCAPLEELNDCLERAWSPVSHLNAVVQTDELRASYEQCLPLLSRYSTELGQNQTLFAAYQALRDSAEFANLNAAQQQAINNNLRDFRLAGVNLEGDKKARYAEIKERLSELSNRFSNNVLDATHGWHIHELNDSRLAGLPKSALDAARSTAESKSLDGYVLTLDAPSYIAVMTYADDRELRRAMYEAYTTRASDQGPQAGQFDNSGLMVEITQLRHELAELLGFANYAEYSLATKMAETPAQVTDFLQQLATRSRALAERELSELTDYARKEHGASELQAWDLAYYSEKLRKHLYDIDQEALRPYFPVPTVLAGLFDVASKLFDVDISACDDMETWHPDVQTFQISRGDNVIARFYLDLYAREHKRGGAWMADCRVRRRREHDLLQLPVAFLTCNFMAPGNYQPAQLTFNEVTTLFHEFGHGLHHMLTQVETAEVSGINGVAWDAVELPSQFLENWCWQAPVLKEMSGHVDTGEALPDAMLNKLLDAKNFQAGMQMLRQVEFALFDFRLHQLSGAESSNHIQRILNQVRDQVAVVTPPESNRFQHSFSHIFAGGYAAGYYSYKWAEVLSADAFSVFEEQGLFDQTTSQRFLHEILERGGSADAMLLFKNFMGREPSVDALLRQSGIAA